MAERDRCVRFADIATGNSFIDGTNGFVHVLVVCCGAGTTFAGSNFLFCIAFGIEFIAVGFDCFVITSIVCSMVAGVVMGIDGLHEKDRFSTFCTVNVVHTFVSGIGAGFLLPCLCVVRCADGAVFAFFSASVLFGQRRLVVGCSCLQFEHLSVRCLLSLVGVMCSSVISAGLDFQPACLSTVAELLSIEALLMPFHKGSHSEAPVPSGKYSSKSARPSAFLKL